MIDCNACQGTGLGSLYETRCHSCKGRGYFPGEEPAPDVVYNGPVEYVIASDPADGRWYCAVWRDSDELCGDGWYDTPEEALAAGRRSFAEWQDAQEDKAVRSFDLSE